MKEYKEHYVAFLDILGFKQLIGTQECEEIYKIFDELHNKSSATLNLNGVQIRAYEHIKHIILSDSIVLFIESDIDDAFTTLIDICGRLQNSLANRDEPILMRGGIAKGDLFYENGIIYGEGLTKAYLLESKLAKYPRIVFSGDTLEAGKKNAKYSFVLLEDFSKPYGLDDDFLYYIDYFIDQFFAFETSVLYFDRLLSLCEKWLNKEIDSNLREKYIWLKKKVEKSIPIFSSVNEVYKKREQEKSEKETKEYNEKFKIFGDKSLKIETVEIK